PRIFLLAARACRSGEETVHEPARRRLALREPGAEQPEAAALRILDPVIVADRIGFAGAFLGPPFLGDALGAVGPGDPVQALPPGELDRRIIGNQPRCLDRLRRAEQPDRTRGLGWSAFSPHPNPPPLAGEGVRFADCGLQTLPRKRGREARRISGG